MFFQNNNSIQIFFNSYQSSPIRNKIIRQPNLKKIESEREKVTNIQKPNSKLAADNKSSTSNRDENFVNNSEEEIIYRLQ